MGSCKFLKTDSYRCRYSHWSVRLWVKIIFQQVQNPAQHTFLPFAVSRVVNIFFLNNLSEWNIPPWQAQHISKFLTPKRMSSVELNLSNNGLIFLPNRVFFLKFRFIVLRKPRFHVISLNFLYLNKFTNWFICLWKEIGCRSFCREINNLMNISKYRINKHC